MADEPQSPTPDIELTTNIVAAYVSRNQIGADQLPVLISTVHHFLSLWILLSAVPAFADRGGSPNGGVGNEHHVHGAPASLLGVGISSALAVGGVLFGVKLWRRRHRK